MRTLISNGTIVTAEGSQTADVLIDGETIVAIGTGLAEAGMTADETIDAASKYVIPGAIDVHTHMELPFGGTFAKDTFESGTRAAAFGGTTTVVDFAVQSRGASLREGLDAWHAKAEGNAVADYGFHMIMSDVNDGTLAEMDQLVAEGVPDFKLFTAYPGVFYSDDGAVFRAMQQTAKNGGLIMMHAENGMAIDVVAEQTVAAGTTDPIGHGLARKAVFEGEATNRVIRLAEAAEVPVYIVHLSAREALEAVREARDRGTAAFAETCPQYLFLSLDDLGNGFEGAKYVCSPPLRTKDHWEDLWNGLVKDDLQVVSTDHCPFDFEGQKELGRGDFRKIPNGLPGVEDRVDLLHDGGVVGRPPHEGALGRGHLDGTRQAVRDVPAEGFDQRRRRRGPGGVRPEPAAHDLGGDPSHGRRLLVLRGSHGPGQQRRRAVARLGHRARRPVHRAQGPRSLRQARPRRVRADGVTADTRRRLSVPADLDRLAEIRALVRDVAISCGAPEICMDELVQAVDEAATNVVIHGYRGGPGELDVTAELVGDRIVITLEDTAPPFDPTLAPRPDVSTPPESRRPGGMGIHLMRLATDSIAHARRPGGGNILTLARRLDPRPKEDR